MNVPRGTSASQCCSRCRASSRRAGQRYCNGCHAAYLREWRRANRPALTGDRRRRAFARCHANVAQSRGQLIPQPCVACGSTDRLEKHHADHARHLDVTWLCRPCHLDLTWGTDRPGRREVA